jgi:hypothetical protein
MFVGSEISAIQGYSRRSIHFRKFILQKLLMLNPCPVYGWKGNLSSSDFNLPPYSRCAYNNSVCQGVLCSKWRQAHRRKLPACWNSSRQRQCQVRNDIFGHVVERIRQTGSLSTTGTSVVRAGLSI